MKSINIQNLKIGGEVIKTEAEVPTKMSELEKDISLEPESVIAKQVKYNFNEDGTLENIEDVTMSGSDIFSGLVTVPNNEETLETLSMFMSTYPNVNTLIDLKGNMNEVHLKISNGESNGNNGNIAIHGPILLYIIDWDWKENTETKKVRTARVRAFGCEYFQGNLKYNYVIYGSSGNKKDCILTITESLDTGNDTYDVYISEVAEFSDLTNYYTKAEIDAMLPFSEDISGGNS